MWKGQSHTNLPGPGPQCTACQCQHVPTVICALIAHFVQLSALPAGCGVTGYATADADHG